MIGCLPTQAIAFEWKPGFTAGLKTDKNEMTAVRMRALHACLEVKRISKTQIL